jgi:NAD(P)-dependent dehydrogenase (short-subunit alcohol dehydrogenase family)
MEFEGKVVLVTGASGGIGMAAARKFAQQGAKVAATGRNQKKLEILTGTAIQKYSADLNNEKDTEGLVRRVLDDFGGIDILVNAAGIIASGTIEDTSLANYDLMMNTNVRSLFHLTQLSLPSIIERKGNVVNVSSVTGLCSYPGVLAYCMSKAAVDHLTRCAALELAPKGVRVNAVNPGVVRTSLQKTGGMTEEAYAAFLERSKTTHPLGRIGEPDEIADLILYLASAKAGWITGVTYSIDGGRAQTSAR